MEVRRRNSGDHAASVTAGSETVVGSAHRIELEVQLPEEV